MARGGGLFEQIVGVCGASAIGMIGFVGVPVSIMEITEYDDWSYSAFTVGLLLFVYILVRVLIGKDEADGIVEHATRSMKGKRR